eukprot:1161235-Pelagomonas_calceolata.AAC.3
MSQDRFKFGMWSCCSSVSLHTAAWPGLQRSLVFPFLYMLACESMMHHNSFCFERSSRTSWPKPHQTCPTIQATAPS